MIDTINHILDGWNSLMQTPASDANLGQLVLIGMFLLTFSRVFYSSGNKE